MGRDLPPHPTLFAKISRALTDPDALIRLPAASNDVDYEGELVVVVGEGGRAIPQERALEHILGYTLMNDVSMRDWQYRTGEWFAGKNFESSTPVGPWVVTRDEVDLASAELSVWVNGELRQHALLSDLVFDPAALVADISRFVALKPGDLIATGTPGGVGYAANPPRFLTDGDLVEISVAGIGLLSNRFVAG
jgi:acylpyruvate hydrolase